MMFGQDWRVVAVWVLGCAVIGLAALLLTACGPLEVKPVTVMPEQPTRAATIYRIYADDAKTGFIAR